MPACRYEPFWDLSLPVAKEKQVGAGIGAWLSNKVAPPTINDCLAAFTAEEVLQVRQPLPVPIVCLALVATCIVMHAD